MSRTPPRLLDPLTEDIGMTRTGPREVLAAAAHQFGVTEAALLGRDRTRPLRSYRMVTMAAMREACAMSYPELGAVFDRDHTTIHYSVQKVAGNDEASAVARTIACKARDLHRGFPLQDSLFDRWPA